METIPEKKTQQKRERPSLICKCSNANSPFAVRFDTSVMIVINVHYVGN